MTWRSVCERPIPRAQPARIGKLDWHRSSAEWSEITRSAKDPEGNDVVGLAAGGAQNRRFITRKVRDALGITKRLEALEPSPSTEEAEAV
jgi:hypothetical protein